MSSYDQGYTCIECECLYDDTDGDTEKRMCNKCLDKISKENTKKNITDLKDKINKLNEYCKYSLSITYYTNGWEISSYKHNTLFNISSEYYQKFRFPRGKTFKEIVNKAYELMLEDKK